MRRRVVVSILVSTRLALGVPFVSLIACHKGSGSDEADAVKPAVGAATIVVTPQAFTETIGAIGTVVPRAGHVATLSAPAPGRVQNVLVTTGQTVSVGQTLIELDQAPFEAALRSAESALSAAEKANERQQRLANEGIVPRKDAETAAADLARARADQVAAQRAASLAVLRAPIAGVVTRMTATLGASVDPASALVEITDPAFLDIVFNVTPTEAGRVRPGAKVSLSAGQSAGGDPLGIGTVSDISGTVDSTNRTVAVRVRASATRRPLRVNETVFGMIELGTKPAAIVIPVEALVPEGEEYKVFVVDPNGIAHERDVKVGGRTNTLAEITDGLRAGERVVTTGAYSVEDSAKVVPLAQPAAGSPAGKAAAAKDTSKEPEQP
jgi:RND family efflux transporter MFP subunit